MTDPLREVGDLVCFSVFTSSSIAAIVLLGVLVGAALERLSARLSSGLPSAGRRTVAAAVVSGALAPFLALSVRSGTQAALAAVLLSVLFTAALTDLQTRRIPNCLTATGLALIFAMTALLEPGFAAERLLFAFLVFTFFLTAALLRPGGLGLGDVKLVAVIGAALGAASVAAIGLALVIGALASAAIVIARGWAQARAVTLPLAPFLAAGSAIILLLGG